MNQTMGLFLRAAIGMILRGRGVNTAKPVPKKRIEPPKGGVLLDVSKKRGRIRRNGPCPCGSARKFKKCHLEGVRSGEFHPMRPVLTGKTATVESISEQSPTRSTITAKKVPMVRA